MLQQKELFFGFHEPIRRNGPTSEFDLSVTCVTRKHASKGIQYRIDFLKKLREKVGVIQRASFKFDKNEIYVVFNVPLDSGIPFYKVGTTNQGHMAFYNKDLTMTIFKAIKEPTKSRAFFEIVEHAKIGSLEFYKLELRETEI